MSIRSVRREAMEIASLNHYPISAISALQAAKSATEISDILRKARHTMIERDVRRSALATRKSCFNVGVVIYAN